MRMGFGLVGLLVTMAIILYVMYGMENAYIPTVLQSGKGLRQQAAQFSGRDTSGMTHAESISLTPEMRGDRQVGVRVKGLVMGGPMEAYFGLQLDDVIVEVGPQRVPDIFGGSDLIDALILDAYQKRQKLVVLRNDVEITLPDDKSSVVAAPPSAAAPASPGSTSPPPAADQESDENKTPLQRQLDALQRISSH